MLIAFLIATAQVPAATPAMPVLPTVPGALNPAVTQANIHQTICVPGWTATIRPKVNITNAIKFALMDKYGIPRSDANQFELDHDVSLENGGSPDSPLNLWLEPYKGKYCVQYCARDKDRIETKLKTLVCAGTITLDEDQLELRTNWIAAYQKRIGPFPVVTIAAK